MNAADGWAIGDPHAVIVATTDGGATWAKQASGYGGLLDQVSFADAQHGWIVGGSANGSAILATSDSGATWHKTWVPGMFTGISAVDPTHAWVVGNAFPHGRVLATGDGQALAPNSRSAIAQAFAR